MYPRVFIFISLFILFFIPLYRCLSFLIFSRIFSAVNFSFISVDFPTLIFFLSVPATYFFIPCLSFLISVRIFSTINFSFISIALPISTFFSVPATYFPSSLAYLFLYPFVSFPSLTFHSFPSLFPLRHFLSRFQQFISSSLVCLFSSLPPLTFHSFPLLFSPRHFFLGSSSTYFFVSSTWGYKIQGVASPLNVSGESSAPPDRLRYAVASSDRFFIGTKKFARSIFVS